jgi:hypothetical protein
MNPMLQQLRAGTKAHIAESPSTITVSRYPLKVDDFGKILPDTDAPPVSFDRVRVRLSRESGLVKRNGETPAGIGTSLSAYVLTDHAAPLKEGDVFTAEGETWTVGPVNTFRRFGGIYKTEAPLVRVKEVS